MTIPPLRGPRGPGVWFDHLDQPHPYGPDGTARQPDGQFWPPRAATGHDGGTPFQQAPPLSPQNTVRPENPPHPEPEQNTAEADTFPSPLTNHAEDDEDLQHSLEHPIPWSISTGPNYIVVNNQVPSDYRPRIRFDPLRGNAEHAWYFKVTLDVSYNHIEFFMTWVYHSVTGSPDITLTVPTLHRGHNENGHPFFWHEGIATLLLPYHALWALLPFP